MTFSEIKSKIKNLGKYKTLKEIKRDDLRIVKNFKTGAYWLIEEEFLKPVIKSPRECKSIVVSPKDLKFKVLMIYKDRKDLRNSKVLKYIKWGESRGFHKKSTCASRGKKWYMLTQEHYPIIWQVNIRERLISAVISKDIFTDKMFYLVKPKRNKYEEFLLLFLNSTINRLFLESTSLIMQGQSTLAIYMVNDLLNSLSIDLKLLEKYRNQMDKIINQLSKRQISSIFFELGAKNPKDVSLDRVKPDRRELDKIVMGEILGLSDEEQLEVYRAVIDLVKSRIEKAKSLGKKKKTKTGIDIDALVDIVLEKIGNNTLKRFYKEKILNCKDLVTKKLPELKDKIEIKKGLFGWQLISGKNYIECSSEAEARYLKIWLEVGVKSIKMPKDKKYLEKVIDDFENVKSSIDQIINDYLGSILSQKTKNQILYQLWQKII